MNIHRHSLISLITGFCSKGSTKFCSLDSFCYSGCLSSYGRPSTWEHVIYTSDNLSDRERIPQRKWRGRAVSLHPAFRHKLKEEAPEFDFQEMCPEAERTSRVQEKKNRLLHRHHHLPLHPASVSLCCMFLVCFVLVSHFFTVCGHLSDINTRLENFKAFSSQRKPESDRARAASCGVTL